MSLPFGKEYESDSGFSIAEVVMASAIMFFALTAMVGLVGTSQKMTVTAKDRSLLTNALSQYADSIRSLEYYQISTLPPDGLVKSEETTSVEGLSIDFYNRVVTPDGESGKYMKIVYINAQTSVHGRTLRTSAVVNVRNPRNDTTAQRITDPNLPLVEFGEATPSDYSIVFHDYSTGSDYAYSRSTDLTSTVRLAASALSPSDVITNLNCYVGNTILHATDGRLAQDSWTPGIQSVGDDWGWNTTNWAGSGVAVYDGLQAVVVQARDSQEREGVAQRYYIVDNVAPVKPAFAAPIAPTNPANANFTLNASADPALNDAIHEPSYAAAYSYRLAKEPASLVTTSADWTTVSSDVIAAGESDMLAIEYSGKIYGSPATIPFSRYFVGARALSPLGNSRLASLYPNRWISGETRSNQFITPAQAISTSATPSTCSAANSQGNATLYSVDVYVTKPSFPCTLSANPVLQKKDFGISGSTWGAATGATFVSRTDVGSYWRLKYTWKDSTHIPGNVAGRNLWFKLSFSVVPSGWVEGTTPIVVYSNAFGAAPEPPAHNNDPAVVATVLPDNTWTK